MSKRTQYHDFLVLEFIHFLLEMGNRESHMTKKEKSHPIIVCACMNHKANALHDVQHPQPHSWKERVRYRLLEEILK